MFVFTLAECGGQNGLLRLFNGTSAMEGKVQFCLNLTWTPVCGDDWDDGEASVVCRQLGFSGEGMGYFMQSKLWLAQAIALQLHEMCNSHDYRCLLCYVHRWRNYTIYSIGAAVIPEGLHVGLVTPLDIKFNCTGLESNLLECSNNSAYNSGSASASGSGSNGASGVQDDLPQPSIDSCLQLARVECNGWLAIPVCCYSLCLLCMQYWQCTSAYCMSRSKTCIYIELHDASIMQVASQPIHSRN